MGKIILTERQLKKLLETGSNSAAMDLDIYVQPTYTDTNNGNLDLVDTIDNVISRLKEINSMFETGKKVKNDVKVAIYKSLDDINKLHQLVKNTP